MKATQQPVALPPMPDPAPTFQIQVDATLLNDFENYSTGSMVMREYAATVSVDGKEIGSVSYAWGGGCAVMIGKRTYLVKFEDIFSTIYEAEQKK